MYEDAAIGILLAILALYVGKLWLNDYRAHCSGEDPQKILPGAVPAPLTAVLIAVLGALCLVIIETLGENLLAISEEQSDTTVFFLPVMLAAGIIEEIIFRGYLVIPNRGRIVLVAGIVLGSLAFTALHTQYWISWSGPDAGWFAIEISLKSAWTLNLLFANSLWFYFVRFTHSNPGHSLLPCFAAHIFSNAAVFLVKLIQGHVIF